MAACRNVETYVAAQVGSSPLNPSVKDQPTLTQVQIIYWVGYNGMDYVLHVFMSDTTELVNRAFVYGIASFPYVITTFIGPAAAQFLYERDALYTGFGIFAVLTPLVTAPLLLLLWSTRKKARSAGVIKPKPKDRTRMETIIHYAVEFDRM